MKLSEHVPDGAAILVDTAPIIYVLEGSPLAVPFESLFADIDAGRIHAVVTPVTLAEVAAGPLRAGREDLVERYRHILTASAGWELRDIDADIAIVAARLRLRHRLRLPDAIQLAVAVHEGCAALVTHHRDFTGVTDIPILGPPSTRPPTARRRRRPPSAGRTR